MKFTVDFFEAHRRPLRLAIDVSIWQFQNQSGQGGTNPAVRTFYFRLLRLLSLPVQPVFIYDGPNKPLVKRNKTVSGGHQSSVTTRLSKKLLQLFRFPYLTAPGEAEAECALLQKEGIVDAVMSEDVDTLMFGAKTVLKDWSSEGNRGNKSPTHVSILYADKIKASCGLDPYGMILVALLSGGDYDTNGLDGFGPNISCEIAKAGFGKDLIKASLQGDSMRMKEWRERLHRELKDNTSGFFKRKTKASIPENFPNETILTYYTNPAISSSSELDQLKGYLHDQWDQDIDTLALREFTADYFDWKYKTGAKKFIRSFAPSILAHRLRRKLYEASPPFVLGICDRRRHFDNDAMPELRLQIIPLEVVGINLSEEQDNPGFFEQGAGYNNEENLSNDEGEDTSGAAMQGISVPLSPRKIRKSPPYNPSLPEKIWLPESIVKTGLGATVEEWEMQQREILADPKKFASRNCPKNTGVLTTQGPILDFLKVQKRVDPLTNFEHRKGTSMHQLNPLPLSPLKNDKLQTRPYVSKNAVGTSRKRIPANPQYRPDRSVNPFSIAQRSTLPPEGLVHNKAAAMANVASTGSRCRPTDTGRISERVALPSSKCGSLEKRPRPTTSESDIDLHVVQTRSRKKGLQRAHTDPIPIDSSSPPPETAETATLTSEISGESFQPGRQPASTLLGPESILGSSDANTMLHIPHPIQLETDLSKNAGPSFPGPNPVHRPQTLTYKAVASRPSLPGYYREVPQPADSLASSSHIGFRSKVVRVSLVDLT